MAVPKRISKVARELGVGVNTIISFLQEKGVTVDKGPNTKIDDTVYVMLLGEYQKDKAARVKSEALREQKVVRETISLDDKKAAPIEEEDLDIPNNEPEEELSIKSSGVTETPTVIPVAKEVEKEEKVEEKLEEPVEIESEVEVEAKVEEVESAKPEEKIEEAISEKIEEKIDDEPEEAPSKGPKLLGKIDIDVFDRKGQKKKKEAEELVKKQEEEKLAKEAEVKVKKEAEAIAQDAPANNVPGEIKTKYQVLDGPKILGKIEIKEEKKPSKEDKKKKQPIASSSEDKLKDRQGKRKRRRIGSGTDVKGKPTNKPKKKPETKELDEAEIQKEIKETLARLTGGGKSKAAKYRRAKRDAASEQVLKQRAEEELQKGVIKATEYVTASELATLMQVSPNEVIAACMELGLFVSINQRLDAETINLIAENFGFEVDFTSEELNEKQLGDLDNEENLEDRPPIVTVMGHVDHGKTSLLDHIRKENVIAGEAGGITQHIGAYSVTLESGKVITFLDTPGHEAFTAMRSRGAQVTDVVIIVIAADDSVMPQTKEAINHAQAANVPIVFAFNKIDREGASPDRLREQLSQINILVEDWGGKYQSQEISAKTGLNVQELLDKVLLEAELLELKADAKRRSNGTILEASLDKGKGYVTTMLVQGGTLRVGDILLAGRFYGRVKAMTNERGVRIKEAGPSTPVSVLGLNGAPSAGDKFVIVEDEKEAKEVANKREQLIREQGVRTKKHITLDEIGRRLAVGDFQELNVIIKGDVDGSIEALADSLENLSTEKIQVNIIHKSVGQISESDVLLASASNAIVIGFQVRPSGSARKLAEKEEIEIRLYSIIYQAIEELKDAMEGMLKPKVEEQIIGNIDIRETFKISKVGTIAGCYVTDGKVTRNSKIRLVRDGIVIYQGNLGSLKRFKDDVKEVKFGYECGLNIENFNDIKVGDNIEVYEEVEVKQSL
jgi:translation initiation factor IF-2